jgi:hypothetical protein
VIELPEFLKLKVNAKGFDIIKFKLGSNFIPIDIDVTSLGFQNADGDSVNAYVESVLLLNNIQNQLKEYKIIQSIDIIDIKPDTIFFEFTPVIEKKVPVGLNADITFLKQFMLKDKILIKPDSILVKGPKKIIDTVQFVETEYINLRDLNSHYTSELNLIKYDKITYSTENVLIEIPVEEYTEVSLNIQIGITNVPDSLTLKIFPNNLNITYLVGFSVYETINENRFEAYVDYSDIENNFTNKLKVKIKDHPVEIKSFQYSPLNVEYIIEK